MMKRKIEKMIPRLRMENESEKAYKAYLRNFFYDLNPPRPDTRYQFAYDNDLKDSAEWMDGPEGLYVKYLEEFYNDYYTALENQVNNAFHMPQQVVNIDTKSEKKNENTNTKLSLKSRIENIINSIKEKRLAKKEEKLLEKESVDIDSLDMTPIEALGVLFKLNKKAKDKKKDESNDSQEFEFNLDPENDNDNDFEFDLNPVETVEEEPELDFDLEHTTETSSIINFDLNPNIQSGLYRLKRNQIIDNVYVVDDKKDYVDNSFNFDLHPLRIEDKKEKVKCIERKCR